MPARYLKSRLIVSVSPTARSLVSSGCPEAVHPRFAASPSGVGRQLFLGLPLSATLFVSGTRLRTYLLRCACSRLRSLCYGQLGLSQSVPWFTYRRVTSSRNLPYIPSPQKIQKNITQAATRAIAPSAHADCPGVRSRPLAVRLVVHLITSRLLLDTLLLRIRGVF